MTLVNPTPLVSVCIFTYNRSTYLKEALDCFAKQISKVDQPVEIVVSDNHSTDDTEEVARLYQSQYPYIIYSRNEENIGVDRNLVKAVTLAQGKYAWLFADDDLISPGALKKVLDVIAANPDVYFILLNYSIWSIDMRQQIQASIGQTQEDKKVTSGQEFSRLFGKHIGFVSAHVVRREEFLQTYPEAYRYTWYCHHWATYVMAIDQPCYYIGFPYLVRREGDRSSWGAVWPLLYTLHFPRLLDDLVPLGYPRQHIDDLRRWLLRTSVDQVLLSFRGAAPEIRRQFDLISFIRLHWRYPEFWYHSMPTLIFRVWLGMLLTRLVHWLDARVGGRLVPVLRRCRDYLSSIGGS
jgi:glycosyltransferase involved in cell wall biosynthesis